jgi:hypothetical protein
VSHPLPMDRLPGAGRVERAYFPGRRRPPPEASAHR